MPRKKFLTPPALPEESQCRGLSIPASQEWLGLFSEALSQTIYAHNYEQVNATDLTPEQTAAIAYERYVAWLSATCGGDSGTCVQPGGQGIYRRSPGSGNIEELVESAWVEPNGDAAIPSAEPRTEPTDDERKCAAAANLENVLHQLWDAVLVMWEEEILPAVAVVDFCTTASLLLGTAFYPPLIGIVALEEVAFDAFYAVMDELTTDMWDAGLTQKLTCIFLEHATVSGGVVTFDKQAIQTDLWTGALSLQTYLLQAGQVQYLLSTIGQQGMDVAGGLNAVSGDCVACGQWSREFDFSLGQMGWGPTTPGDAGTWSSSGYWQNVTSAGNSGLILTCNNPVNAGFTITRVYVEYYIAAGLVTGISNNVSVRTHSPTRTLALPQSEGWNVYDTGYTLNWVNAGDLAWYQFRAGVSVGAGYRLGKMRVWGEGVMPFSPLQGVEYYGS